MKDKVLIVASVASMIDQFNMPNIILLKKMGYEVDVACNFVEGNTCSFERIQTLKEKLKKLNVDVFQIDFCRSPMAFFKNIKAYKQVLKLMRFTHYRFVHCHSPIGGLCARIAAHKTQTKVIYTAHGFHFYKGAPLKNWLLYYPAEWLLAYWTDVLITINKEDYGRALQHLHARKVIYVPGVGIDLQKFHQCVCDENIQKLRQEIQIPENYTWVISVGELIPRKNQETLIRAVASVENVFCTIIGRGELQEYLEELIVQLNVNHRVRLLGYRTDVNKLCQSADVFALPSFHEGLSVALMEAMACGLPIICSNIRGNIDLIDEQGGCLFDPHNEDDCSLALTSLLSRDLKKVGSYNAEKVKQFALERVQNKMHHIYLIAVGELKNCS